MALSNKLAPFSEGAEPPVVTASEESEVQKTLVKHWGFFVHCKCTIKRGVFHEGPSEAFEILLHNFERISNKSLPVEVSVERSA